jgi:hypothetical protein
MPRIKVILEYDMGEYEEEDVPKSAQDLSESFFQRDVIVSDMDIIGMKVDGKVVR